MRPVDAVTLAGVGIGVYLLWKWTRFSSAVGEAVGDAAQGAYSIYLDTRYGAAEMTPAAKLTTQDYVDKGYMVKTYAPFTGCTGESCYRYDITPAGNAYIEQQKQLAGMQ